MLHKCGASWAGTESPSEFQAFFMNTEDDALETRIPAGRWVRCKIPNLPAGVKFCHALVSGILIVTGYPPPPPGSDIMGPTCIDVTVAFRRVGDVREWGYVMQTVEPHRGGGQRSNAACVIPLNDAGEFEIKWTKLPAGILPNWAQGAPAEGINLMASMLWERA